ncbi:TonB family protein [Pontibacter diazotrophicus]|uniref:TonB family protein n=1 Tax=Pontibacter diazotrophicus TaxID=1400979 RepID=A0A3D8L8N3_9BACT|nr:TonB family protein [Pontibacter diazotrophicus]RDV13734.1 TonB family protein [Pontibacter diazotrophicus]
MKNKLSLSCLAVLTLLGSAVLFLPEAHAQSTASAETIYSYVEEPPAFEGGDAELMNFVASNIQYPQDARAAGLTGIVVLTFVVEKNGTISNIETIKSLSKSTDAEAVRVIGLTEGKWSIGRQHGKALRVKQTFPVKFSLDKDGNPTVLHRMPQFKGGQKAMVQAIYSNLKVPAAAQQENITARVQVKFNVKEDGTVSNIAIANTKLKHIVGAGADMDYMDASTFKLQNKAVLAELSTAAAEAIQGTSGKWEPGTRYGKPIAAEVTLPVLFSGSQEPKLENQLEAMLLSYQPDAYDKKFSYKDNEVDARAALKDGTVEQFLAKHLRYPDTSFEGIVKVAFLVADDGRLFGPMTNVSKDEKAIADEFSRVFELTEGNWIPAKKNTQPISAMQEITVEFMSKKGEKNPTRNANVVVTR